MGAIAPAWLTALPCPVIGLSDLEFGMYARRRLEEDLLPRLGVADESAVVPASGAMRLKPNP